VGMESKWIFFDAKKRSPATMPSRFCIRAALVREAKGKLMYFFYYSYSLILQMLENVLVNINGRVCIIGCRM
jgi:hypothetical protein